MIHCSIHPRGVLTTHGKLSNADSSHTSTSTAVCARTRSGRKWFLLAQKEHDQMHVHHVSEKNTLLIFKIILSKINQF